MVAACYYTHVHQFSFQCVQWTLDLTDSWKRESPVYFLLARSQDQSRDYNISEMQCMLWCRADRWVWVRSGRRRFWLGWASATVCHTLAAHAHTTAPKIGLSQISNFLLLTDYYYTVKYYYNVKLLFSTYVFSASLLQSSVSHNLQKSE